MQNFTDNELPSSYEEAERGGDLIDDLKFTKLLSSAIIEELFVSLGIGQEYLPEMVRNVKEILDFCGEHCIGPYVAGRLLGYDVFDPTESAIISAADTYYRGDIY